MRLVRTAAILVTVMIAALLLVSVPPAQGAPSADGTLNNPSFEAFTKSTTEPDWNGVADGWTPWWASVGDGSCPTEPSGNYFKPKYEQEMHGTHVHGGTSSARMYVGYHVMDSGYYQQVAATAGTTYQFGAWGLLWEIDEIQNAVVDRKSDAPTITFQVGIDPAGGTSASAAKWSGGGNTMDTFFQQTVSAVATGNKITVFVRATAQYCVARNDAFFDDASLTATATGPAPGATAAPGAKPTKAPSGNWGATAGTIVTVTPGADGSVIHTVGPGQTCIGIATAYGADYDTFLKLNNLTNATCKFISVGLKLTIKPAGGASPGDTGGKATAAPTEAATEAPTVAPTEAVQTGTVCVLGYDDKSGNGIREPTEPKLAGMTFTISGASGPVANYTTDGAGEPHCFAQLAPGSYTVKWEGDGLSPSPDGSSSWPVTVTAGSSASHEFGASTSGSTGGGSTSGGTTGGGSTGGTGGSTPGLPTWAIALIGAFGVILFMGGLGVAGYFLLLRRTNI